MNGFGLPVVTDVLVGVPASLLAVVLLWDRVGAIRRRSRFVRAAVERKRRGRDLRLVPALKPVRTADPAEIYRVGRVPLEYNLDSSHWSRVLLWFRLFLLGPGYPKPAFAVTAVTEIPESEFSSSPDDSHVYDGFQFGGYRLKVDLAPGESPRHLIRSMDSGLLTWTRTVVVCSPGELANKYPNARYYTVYAAPTREQRVQLPRVILKSADPLFSGARDDPSRRPDGHLDNVIWLVEIGSRDPADDRLDDHRNQRIPKPLLRRVHYCAVGVSLGLVLTLVLSPAGYDAVSRVMAVFPEWLQFAVVLVAVLEVVIGLPIALFAVWRSSWFEYRAGRAEDLRGLNECGDGTSGGSSLSSNWRRWLPWHPPRGGWTASTTDCIADGFAVRNRPPYKWRFPEPPPTLEDKIDK